MVLLLTNNFPPYVGGSSQILYELLKHFDKDDFKVYHGVGSTATNKTSLPFVRKQILVFNSLLWTQRFLRYLPLMYAIVLTISILIKEKKKNVDAIYAHYPNAAFMISAYFLSKLYRKPLIVYYDIVWKGRGIKRDDFLANLFEKHIIKHAKVVIAITEHLAKHLTDQYGVICEVIPHTTSQDLISTTASINKKDKPFKIHFAGAIYPRMNLDALVRLAHVIKKLPFTCELELCTTAVPTAISDIVPVTHKYLNHTELILTQKNSDILFLPQAFESDSPLMINLNMPTKAMEYICAGKPILVHSPADSYLTWLAQKEKFAYVVDVKSEDELVKIIMQIKNNPESNKIIAENAEKFAQNRSSNIWSAKFRELIQKAIISN